MAHAARTLFPLPPPPLPEGMRYAEDVVSPEEEQRLAAFIASLPLKPFEFTGGFKGNRRVLSFGWRYDFNSHRMSKADPVPALLQELCRKAAPALACDAGVFEQALVTEYAEGAGIGWHKDRPVFDDVIGISLLSACPFRFRRKAGTRWERATLEAKPRSAYLLGGPARWDWQHSISPVSELRYSVTFRALRGGDIR